MNTTSTLTAVGVLAAALAGTVAGTVEPASAATRYVAYAYTGDHLRANASWSPDGDVLCVRIFGGRSSDTAKARLVTKNGALVAELVDRGGDDEKTCRTFASPGRDGREAVLTVARTNRDGTTARGSNEYVRV